MKIVGRLLEYFWAGISSRVGARIAFQSYFIIEMLPKSNLILSNIYLAYKICFMFWANTLQSSASIKLEVCDAIFKNMNLVSWTIKFYISSLKTWESNRVW